MRDRRPCPFDPDPTAGSVSKQALAARSRQRTFNSILGFVGRGVKRRGRWRVATFGGAALSCTIALAAHAVELDPPYPQRMAELCAENGGWNIYQTADNVQGYYLPAEHRDGAPVLQTEGCPSLNLTNLCLTALTSYGFQFVETEVKVINSYSINIFVESPGIYKFTLERAGHPNCRAYEKILSERVKSPKDEKSFYSGHRTNLRGKCVAANPISRTQSRYVIKNYYDYETYKDEHGSVGRVMTVVLDMERGVTMAVYYFYIFAPNRSWHSTGVRGCLNVPATALEGIRDVLRTTQ